MNSIFNIFNICDRCGANAKSIKQIKEFEIYMTTHISGDVKIYLDEYKPLDLCHICANQFIRWFGAINPVTGLHLQKYSE